LNSGFARLIGFISLLNFVNILLNFIPITATLGTTTWKTSLLPGKGIYFIALKAGVRKKEKVGHGDKVTISFIQG
jgi:hypothetical protein